MAITRFFSTILILLCTAFATKAEEYVITPGMDFDPENAGLKAIIDQSDDVFAYFNDPDHPESNPYDIRICGSEYLSRGAYIYLRGSRPCDYYIWTFPFYDNSGQDISGSRQKARQLFDTMCDQLSRAGYNLEKIQDDPSSGTRLTGLKGKRAITLACFSGGNRCYVQLHLGRQ